MALERKQQIMVVVIVIAFAFVLWQLYDILGLSSVFGGNQTTANTTTAMTNQPTSLANSQASKSSLPAQSDSMNTSVSQTPSNSMAAANTENDQARNMADPNNQSSAANVTSKHEALPLTAVERQYLDLANKLQLLKMQRQVLQEQEAIAETEKKLRELGVGGAGQQLTAQTSTGSTDLKLVYLDYQQGQWTATVSMGGRFYEVNRGTMLADGFRVAHISSTGVVVSRNGQRNLLSFSGMMPLAGTKATTEAAPYQHEQPLGVVKPRYKPSADVKHTTQAKSAPATTMKTNTKASAKDSDKTPSKTDTTTNTKTNGSSQVPAMSKPASASPSSADESMSDGIKIPEKKSNTDQQSKANAGLSQAKASITHQQQAKKTSTNQPTAALTKQSSTASNAKTTASQQQTTVANQSSSKAIVKTAKPTDKQRSQDHWVMVTPKGEQAIQPEANKKPELSMATLMAHQAQRPAKASTASQQEAGDYNQLMAMLNGNAKQSVTDKQTVTPAKTNHAKSKPQVALNEKEAKTFAELENYVKAQKAKESGKDINPGFSLVLRKSYSQQSLLSFVEKNNLQNSKIISSNENGKAVYFLVVGNYQSFTQAEAARDNMPAALKQGVQITSNSVLNSLSSTS